MKLQETYRDRGLQVVMVAGELPEEIKTEPFYAKAPVTVVHGGDSLGEQYGVSGVPHTFYFNKGGHVALELDGYSESYIHQLEERLAKDLGEARSASG